MRVLVMGGEGQLGRTFRRVFAAEDSEIVSWDLPDYDMTKPEISDQIVDLCPDLVLNAGAWTDVDGAESNRDVVYASNALGPKHLAEACRRCSVPLVQISTNEVFAGEPDTFYYEYDQPTPHSVYARSKAAGEQAVRSTVEQHYIVRVAWLYGVGGNHFPAKIIAAADKFGSLKVVDDEIGNPTFAEDAAEAIRQIVQTQRYGTYHLINEGFTSRYELAAEALQLTGRSGTPLERIKVADWPRPAPPPLHAVIVNQAAAAMGIVLPPWQESLARYLSVEGARFAR